MRKRNQETIKFLKFLSNRTEKKWKPSKPDRKK